MDSEIIYFRTAKGEAELKNEQLSLELHDILSRIDGKTSIKQMMQDASFWSAESFESSLNELLAGGYIRSSSGEVLEEPAAAEKEPVAEQAEASSVEDTHPEKTRSAGKSKFAQSTRTLIASVLFLDIVEYTRKPVADQFRIKEAFNRLVYDLVRKIPEDDRIIVDTGDGAALGFLADPEEVLMIAIRLRDALEANDHKDYPDTYVRMGINLGPVKLVADMNGRENLIGDGVNDANRIMGFAQGDQVLISRSFYDVVSRLSAEHHGLFKYQGIHKDKHRREHEVYEVGGGKRAAEQDRAREKSEEEIRAERLEKMKAKLESAAKAEAEAKAAREAQEMAREAQEVEMRKKAEARTAAEKTGSIPRKKKKGAGKAVAVALIVLIAAAVGILPFVPLGFLAKAAADSISAKTGKAVSVGSAFFSLLPTPRIVLKEVSDGQGIRVAKMTEDLLGSKAVVIDGLTASQDVLPGISGWKGLSRQVEFDHVSLSLGGKSLPLFGGEIEIGQDGSFMHARIESDGMNADIVPSDSGFKIELDAKNWSLPLGPACPWATIHANAIASGGGAKITSVTVSGYGGTWSGSGSIAWDQGWRAAGRFKGKELDIEMLLPYFSKDASLKGSLDFDAAVASSATSLPGLFDSPRIDALFRLRDGTVGKVDVAQAMRMPSPEGTRGGETKYDELSGSLSLSGGEYRYSGLKLNSGILKASGELDVREGKLSGRTEVFLGQMRSAMTLGGSLLDPVIR